MNKVPNSTLLISLLLSGCMTVGPDYQQPKMVVPKQWSTSLEGIKANQQLVHWWQQFKDAELNRLMINALSANLDFKQTVFKIKDLRAQRAAVFSDALPKFTVRSTPTRRFNNISGTSGSTQSGGGLGIGNNIYNIFQNGFDAQWEIDFFGGVQRALESAQATIDSELENSRAVQVTLLAEVASYYLQLRENQQLLSITQANLETQRESWELSKVRQQSGFASLLEVTQAEAQVAETEAQLPTYQIQITQSIHALSVLLAKQPDELASQLTATAMIPQPAALLWPDLPSELLQRRPDIRRAERQLAAATADIGVATSQLYPKLSLTAFLGLQNTKITEFTPISKSWSTAASLSMPILNWGKITANIDSKKAIAEQQSLAYQATVLTAFKEVEDALVAYTQELQRQQWLNQSVAANKLAVQLANERYQKGLTSYLDVLTSQQMLYVSESKLATSKAELSSQFIALYKALGGGWQS